MKHLIFKCEGDGSFFINGLCKVLCISLFNNRKKNHTTLISYHSQKKENLIPSKMPDVYNEVAVEEEGFILWLQKFVLSYTGHYKDIVIILLDQHIFNTILGCQWVNVDL